jgi:hypothetical protein
MIEDIVSGIYSFCVLFAYKRIIFIRDIGVVRPVYPYTYIHSIPVTIATQ